MKTKTIKTELLINDKKVIVNHRFLENIVRYISDIKENQIVFDSLVLSDNPEVREYLTQIDNMSKKSIYALLKDPYQEIVKGVLSNPCLARKISEKKLLKIVNLNNTILLITIGNNLGSYIQCNLYKIFMILANHDSTVVRCNIVGNMSNEDFPNKILKQLLQDKDIELAQYATKILERNLRE